ncbi:MLO-like protein 13 [Platanthera zijinensis]|uniref:MLO-like protein n=1 Tax=Platanthera zijinensis TaxID=2320716 RepID=A0AAP0BFU0_9ASPA
MASGEESETLEYTATWVVAVVCAIIVIVSLLVERFLHYLGKFLIHQHQDALFRALEKLKEELMLLGFISLFLTVSQSFISDICIPERSSFHMLPCNKERSTPVEVIHHRVSSGITWKRQRLLSGDSVSDHCASQGKVQLLSLEALHQLHILIFVLAVVHVVFCATTMVLGGARVNSLQMCFFKQFYGSVTKSDYKALRSGFIMSHCPTHPKFDFHKYMIRALEDDFKKVVGISWYLWLFVIIFLLINIHGWHAYFWLSFLPLILVVMVGAKLEHVITRLAIKLAETPTDGQGSRVKPSDEHFWFQWPSLILYLIHFILFQNSFEIAFLFWIIVNYGFHSCILENVAYIVPRIVVGVIVQVLSSYSTLPLYAIVTQMGDSYKQAIFARHMQSTLHGWAAAARKRRRSESLLSSALMTMFGRKKKKPESSGSKIQLQGITGAQTSSDCILELPANEELQVRTV